LSFNGLEIGAGGQYNIHLNRLMEWQTSLLFVWYTGQLNFDIKHGWVRQDLGLDVTAWRITSNLSDASIAYRLMTGLRLQILPRVSLLLNGELRYLKLDQFTGRGVLNWFGDLTGEFTSELVQASNYFGVSAREPYETGIIEWEIDYILEELSFRTKPDPEARRPAQLDFSSFGLVIGIEIRL
jgi:hypothetical protein